MSTLIGNVDITNFANGPTTVGNLDLYVATTGSDVTGDGSASNPFQTMPHAYRFAASTLLNVIHIHVAAGTYTDLPEVISHCPGGAGFISFDASAAMADVSGTLTVGPAGETVITTSAAAEVPVVGGGMTPNEYRKKHLLFLTGARAGELTGVIGNTATEIRYQASFIGVSAGDTFKIMEPGVTVNLPSANRYTITGAGNSDPVYVGFFGMAINYSGRGLFFNDVTCSFIGSVLDGPTRFRDANTGISLFGIPDVSAVLDEPGWVNNYSGSGIFAGDNLYTLYGGSNIYKIVTEKAGFDCLRHTGEVGFCAICAENSSSYGYGLDIYSSNGMVRVYYTYIHAKTSRDAIRGVAHASISVDEVYVEQGRTAVRSWPGSGNLNISALTGVDANVTNAVEIGNGVRAAVEASSVSLVGVGGAANAIKWTSGAANSPYPAANNLVTDSLGAQVVGY